MQLDCDEVRCEPDTFPAACTLYIVHQQQTHSQQQPEAGVYEAVPVSPLLLLLLLLLLQVYLTLQQEQGEEEK